MRISLISFYTKLNWDKRLEKVAEILNETKSDIVVFAGHALKDHVSLERLRLMVNNENVKALIEIKHDVLGEMIMAKNSLYWLERGEVMSMHTHQVFSTSGDIEKNTSLCEYFIQELQEHRTIKIDDKLCALVLQCGELNIIKNLQSEGNRPVFRIENLNFERRFNDMLSKVQFIFNPIHTPMGNQGKMEKRRELLSQGGRYYFSVSNSEDCEIKNKVVYAFFNGKPIETGIEIPEKKGYKETIVNL